jgi:DNA-directed RNA polymerase specialized sigma24 family protein
MKVTDRRKDLEVLNVEDRVRFEQLVFPHLDTALNFAAWLLSSRSDAEDVTQEATPLAHRFLPGFYGGDVRAWLL